MKFVLQSSPASLNRLNITKSATEHSSGKRPGGWTVELKLVEQQQNMILDRHWSIVHFTKYNIMVSMDAWIERQFQGFPPAILSTRTHQSYYNEFPTSDGE